MQHVHCFLQLSSKERQSPVEKGSAPAVWGNMLDHQLGARLRGRTATQRSKKGSEKVLGRVLGKGSHKGSEKGAWYGFYNKKGF